MNIKSYSHIAFQVKEMEAMLQFYCEGLGMKQKFVLTADDIVAYAQQDTSELTEAAKAHIEAAKAMQGKPLIVYVEMAPQQFLEFFYVYEPLMQQKKLEECYGYQHLAIEVDDIEETYREVVKNGITPDTEIAQGSDYTKQFWIHDPEGNRIEFMEYTSKSLQIVGKETFE